MTSVPYYELAELANIYLEDSFVLGITIVPGLAELSLDVVLRENHPEYRPPLRSEQYCFRRGVLRLEGVESVEWNMPQGMPAIDVTGDTDYGGIDSYHIDGSVHHIVGELGQLTVTCQELNLILYADT